MSDHTAGRTDLGLEGAEAGSSAQCGGRRSRVVGVAAFMTACVASVASGGLGPAADGGRGDGLHPGGVLTAHQQLVSPNRLFRLTVQGDCDLVLSGPGAVPLWAAGTGGQGGHCTLENQSDGNVVLYTSGHVPLWSTGTAGQGEVVLTLQNDGNAVAQAAGQKAVFASGSAIGHGTRVRVLDFNIWGNLGWRGASSAPVVDSVLAAVRKDAPSAVTLQEVCRPQLNRLARDSGMHSHFSVTKIRGCQDGSDYGLAVLTRDPIVYAPAGHLLSDKAPLDLLDEQRKLVCAATRALWVCSAHLTNGTSAEAAVWRRREAEKISRLLKPLVDAGAALALGLDANAEPAVLEDQLPFLSLPAFRGARGDRYNTHESASPTRKIDSVLVAPRRFPSRYAVEWATPTPRDPRGRPVSDHLPVHMTASLEQG